MAGRDPGYAERSLLNAPIQGSAAEIIKVAMVNLQQTLRRIEQEKQGICRLVLQVHDELVVEVEERLLDEVTDRVRWEMEQSVQLRVPLKVDISVGPSWGKAL